MAAVFTLKSSFLISRIGICAESKDALWGGEQRRSNSQQAW